MGRSCLVGSDRQNNIKLDVFYSTGSFRHSPHEEDAIRIATADDILAMKIDTLQEMLSLHKRRAEFTSLLNSERGIRSPVPIGQKKSPVIGQGSKNMAATYSPALWCSTIGHEGLNFSVRYGKR